MTTGTQEEVKQSARNMPDSFGIQPGAIAHLPLADSSRKSVATGHPLPNSGRLQTLSQAMAAAALTFRLICRTGPRCRPVRAYYLGGRFSLSNRLRAATNHYLTITRHFKPEFLLSSASGRTLVWQKKSDNLEVKIGLRFPYHYNFDGDQCLILAVNGADACILTFSIAPGSIVSAAAEQILLVSGVQGHAGKIEDIRLATEFCNNVSPAHLLLFAAEALALAIGVQMIVGIGRSHMIEAKPAEGRSQFDYDFFWKSITGDEETCDFYCMPLPLTSKPIESISAKHRKRALKRRELRNEIRAEIALQVNNNLASHCLKDQ